MDLEDVLDFIDSILPGPLPEGINISVGMPAMVSSHCTPMALRRAASSRPGQIVIHRDFFETDTAAGIALIAHEVYHQIQFARNPDLLDFYAEEEARVEALGLPPYENVFEKPAYLFEAQVYREALAQGFPKGTHLPLLIEEGLAGYANGSGRMPILLATGIITGNAPLIAFGGIALTVLVIALSRRKS